MRARLVVPVLPAAVAGVLALPAGALAAPTPPPGAAVCVDIEIGPGTDAAGCAETPPPDTPEPSPEPPPPSDEPPAETPEPPAEP
ncbi:OmpA family protein, partial [Actinomadura latina]|nr:OmpA family protein [Actinomadura latina]